MLHEIAQRLVEPAEKAFGANPYYDSRELDVFYSRMAVMVILYAEKFRISHIAREFGKNHASVIHCVQKRHVNLIKFDRDYQTKYRNFLKELRLMEMQNPFLINDHGLMVTAEEFINGCSGNMLYNVEKLLHRSDIQARIKSFKSTHSLIT